MPVTNSHIVSDVVAAASMSIIEADSTFLKMVYRDPELFNTSAEGEDPKGYTRTVRIPGYGKWRSGAVADPAAIAYDSYALTIAQGGTDFILTAAEEKLEVNELEKIIRTRVATVVNQLDTELWNLTKKVPICLGTAGSLPTVPDSFFRAKALISQIGGAMDDGSMAVLLHEEHQASLAAKLPQIITNSTASVSEEYTRGKIGVISNMKWSSDRNASVHTSGTYAGTITVKTTMVEGATTLVLQGFTAGNTLKAGDSFTVGSVFAVRPVGKGNTGLLKPMCLAADATANGSGEMTVTLTEAIKASTTDQFQNVNALPQASASVTIYSASNTTSRVSLVMHPEAFIFASTELPERGQNCTNMKAGKNLKLNIRCYRYDDGNQDTRLWRLDVMTGCQLARPGFAARILG